MSIDRLRAQAGIKEFLLALGHELPSVDLTARRVTEAYADELLSGYGVDLSRLIEAGSEPTVAALDPVILDGIELSTVCPHHLLVARGQALVAYVPGDKVLGLGTLAHLVNACSRRFMLQEQIASAIVEALMDLASARGAFCRVELDHACLQTRGARQARARAITWASAGELSDPAQLETIVGRFLRGSQAG